MSWVYLEHVLYSISMCLCFLFLFFSTVTNEMESSHIKKRPPPWCQNWTEQREETLYQKVGGLGCHRMVTFCVERHYDNEQSFSIISTSRATFPLMYFSKGNALWQSYLLHCTAGLFLEVTFKKKSSSENICANLYQSNFPQCIIGCYGK